MNVSIGNDDVSISSIESNCDFGDTDRAAPLPAVNRRGSTVDNDRYSRFDRRRTSTSASIATFSSKSSFVTSDPLKVVEVGNLIFLNDNDMKNGQSPILGKGSFGMVRLARRQRSERRISALSNITDEDFPDTAADAPREDEVLVAVKIFEKSLLQKCKTLVRDSDNQMQVHTAFDNVEREIAVMKMLQHPNLVSLHEVIDTGSSRLYMVLEYLPLGEIMTNIDGTEYYSRRPSRNGEHKVAGVTRGGHFDEEHAALYFVDIMHGLAHLHKNHIVHRDLKPENILLDSRGFAKIGDFGVCHLFENETNGAEHFSSLVGPHQTAPRHTPSHRISGMESDAALRMESMSDKGKLTKTEGTWAFWSPEMCAENSLVFSGYACDIWAAGICLYIFATGKLPFYSHIPIAIFDMIAEANVNFDNEQLSDTIVDMLKKVLEKDPSARAGVGDCLRHAFCKDARNQRIKELGEEVEKNEEIVLATRDLQKAIFKSNKRSLLKQSNSLRSSMSKLSSFGQWVSGLRHSRSMTNLGEADDNDKSGNEGMEENRLKRGFVRKRINSPSLHFWRHKNKRV